MEGKIRCYREKRWRNPAESNIPGTHGEELIVAALKLFSYSTCRSQTVPACFSYRFPLSCPPTAAYIRQSWRAGLGSATSPQYHDVTVPALSLVSGHHRKLIRLIIERDLTFSMMIDLLLAWMLGSSSPPPPISSSSACGECQVFSSGCIVLLNS